MCPAEERVGSLIEPLYAQDRVSGPIDICTAPIQLMICGQAFEGTAQVTMEFIPNDKLVFRVNMAPESQHLPFCVKGEAIEMQMLDRNVSVPLLQSSIGRYLPKSSVVTATKPTADINRTVFHVFNFPAFFSPTNYIAMSTPAPNTQSYTTCGCVTLRAGGWKVTIAAKHTTVGDERSLEEQGGWLITHVGEIVLEDGLSYNSEQLVEVLQCLHNFLSFALGRWVGVALPVGFDVSGSRVFEQWGMPLAAIGSWDGSVSWFDDQHGESLVDLFPGFWALFHREPWTRSLREALYWYLSASRRTPGVGFDVDVGLVTAQSALELLAWNYCVRDRKMVSTEAFKPRGLSASDRLRLLASTLDLPLNIPNQLTALHARRAKPWADAMDAITGVRNSLVHPHDNRDLPENSSYDAWRLSLWYLDLVILRLCGYKGKYGNRLKRRWSGQVERVPWVTEAENAS